MIVFEAALVPTIRAGEAEIGGRRIAGRLLPCAGESRGVRFDVVERRFAFRRPEGAVRVGPADADAWRDAVSRLPAGPILVGPCFGADETRRAFQAAAAAALDVGRSVYLLDPDPGGLPKEVKGAVALCSWAPGPDAFPALAGAAGAGLPCAAVFPLIPGWTAEPTAFEGILSEARAGGAVSATAVRPEADGEARRAIVDARAAVEPDAAEPFFDLIHHSDWTLRLADRLAEVRDAAGRLGLAALPPRPVGWREPVGNSRSAGKLEELADLSESDEHRAALLRGAARWIDECGRDLSAVAREGNFRRIFPFPREVAEPAEAALREQR